MRVLFFILFPLLAFGQVQYKGQTVFYKGQPLTEAVNNSSPSPSCSDGIQNGDETGVDCGGSCSPCSDPSATIVATDNTATEAGLTIGFYTITLSETNSTGSAITINYNVTGTATSGSDYVALSGTASIADGTSSITVNVTPLEDLIVEGSETVIATLTSGTGYVVGSPNSATVTITSNDSGGSGGNPDWFAANPSVSEPADNNTYTPTSSGDITNVANAGRTAIISNSFDCNGCTFAANQKIRPAGGAISGSNINLNGAYIDDVPDQAFDSSARFSAVYEDSWVYAETFGAVSNDAGDDSDAIDAAHDNCKFSRLNGGTYVKNSPSFTDGVRDVIFDLNASKIELTSGAGYNQTTDQQGVFMYHAVNPKFFNGEIDGNNHFGAAFRIGNPQAYHFEDLFIHHLENDPYSTSEGHRTIAFDIDVTNTSTSRSWFGGLPWTGRNSTTVFENGYINNCTIEDLSATGSGLPSNSCQAIWWRIGEVNNTNNALAFQSNNIIRRLSGDEAEGIYWNGDPGIIDDHALALELQTENISECGDRAIKATSSNITINNSTFGEPTVDIGRTLVEIFTLGNQTNTNSRIKNVTITNNTFNDTRGNVCNFISLGDVQNVTVTGNDFNYGTSGNYSAIGLGTLATAPANGWAENMTISGNTYINSGLELRRTLTTSNVVVENETFTWNHTGTGGGQTQALIRARSNGDYTGFIFRNSNANVTITSAGDSFTGLLYIDNDMTGMDIDNVDLTYTSSFSNSTGEFGYITGNFDSSNTIDDCDMVNASGTGALQVDGTQGAIITNSFGQGATAITMQ